MSTPPLRSPQRRLSRMHAPCLIRCTKEANEHASTKEPPSETPLSNALEHMYVCMHEAEELRCSEAEEVRSSESSEPQM